MGALTHGEVLDAAVDQEMEQERGRKASFEQRGAWVVVSSGTLTTLLFALVSTVTKVEGFVLPVPSRWAIGAALLFFAAAAGAAIYLNWPQKNGAGSLDVVVLADYATSDRGSNGDAVAQKLAEARVETLRGLRTVNNRKASGLLGALTAEAAAVICLAGGVLLALLQSG